MHFQIIINKWILRSGYYVPCIVNVRCVSPKLIICVWFNINKMPSMMNGMRSLQFHWQMLFILNTYDHFFHFIVRHKLSQDEQIAQISTKVDVIFTFTKVFVSLALKMLTQSSLPYIKGPNHVDLFSDFCQIFGFINVLQSKFVYPTLQFI